MMSPTLCWRVGLVLLLGAMVVSERRYPGSEVGEATSACQGGNLHSDASLGVGILEGDVACGKEESITVGDFVEVEFKAFRYDTCEAFDLTAKDETFSFQMGRQEVVKGWEVGLLGACVGQKRRLTVASGMGFGDEVALLHDGRTEIPPGTTLVYELVVVGVFKGELPTANVEVPPEVQAALEREKKNNRPWKFNSPKTHKDRIKNLKMSNHEAARRGLQIEKRRLEEIDRKRRMLKEEKEAGMAGLREEREGGGAARF